MVDPQWSANVGGKFVRPLDDFPEIRERAGLDEWFYLTSVTHDACKTNKTRAIGGTRTVMGVDVGDIAAYRKYDTRFRGRLTYDGGRDKIAADLAQVIGVNVPATVLCNDRGEFSCVQKAPSALLHQNLQMFHDAVRANPPLAEVAIASLASRYDPANFVFDVWMGNVDRRINYKNTLISETSSGFTVWLIDFDNALGHRIRPWSEDGYKACGLTPDESPLPYCLKGRGEFLSNFERFADRIESTFAIGDNLIEEICRRVGLFYGDEVSLSATKTIADGLKFRKAHLREWSCELLKN